MGSAKFVVNESQGYLIGSTDYHVLWFSEDTIPQPLTRCMRLAEWHEPGVRSHNTWPCAGFSPSRTYGPGRKSNRDLYAIVNALIG